MMKEIIVKRWPCVKFDYWIWFLYIKMRKVTKQFYVKSRYLYLESNLLFKPKILTRVKPQAFGSEYS